MEVAESAEDVRGYELAHREALRALDYQRAALDALRSRVGLLLSAGAIATSFLGGQALRTEANAWAWTAIVFFVVFGAVSLRILWPRAEGAEGFTAVPSGMIAEYLRANRDIPCPRSTVSWRCTLKRPTISIGTGTSCL